MKRMTLILGGMLLAGVLGTLAGAQSLGDTARAVRKEQKPTATKKFDNDNLPRTDKLSVVGNPSDTSSSPNQQAAMQDPNAPASEAAPPTTVTPGQSPDDRQKVYDEWKGKIGEQKSKLDLLARELDVQQREYRLRAASFYADAGNRLRGSANWDKEDAQYKKQIEQRQKAVEDAKKKLEDLQEQARKSGVPASQRQ